MSNMEGSRVKEEKLMKYPKIELHTVNQRMHIPEGSLFQLSEKIDGSQFRSQINRDGSFTFGTKAVTFDQWHPIDHKWNPAAEKMKEALSKFMLTQYYTWGKIYTFFTEYLEKPQHNTVKYKNVPKNNHYLFDISVDGEFLKQTARDDEIGFVALLMGIEPVNVLSYYTFLPPMEEIEKVLGRTKSTLGGTQVEGVVLKNYDAQVDQMGKIFPLFIKYVREEFSEVNKAIRNKNSTNKSGNVLDRALEPFNKDTIFRKAIEHVRDGEGLEYQPQDIPKLWVAVERDFEDEYLKIAMGAVEDFLKDDLLRLIKKGLPEYYKEFLERKNMEA